MNKFQRGITITHIGVFIISIIAYISIRISNTFSRNFPVNDEISFLKVFVVFIEQGYYKATAFGNSIVFNGVSFVFNEITSNNLMALKATSLFFGVLSLVALYWFFKLFFSFLPKIYIIIAYLTSINIIVVSSFVFSGINDSILIFLTILSFIFIFKLKKRIGNEYKWHALLGLVLALMLLTRKMSILIICPIIVIMTIQYVSEKKLFKDIIFKGGIMFVVLFLVLFIFNIPSLIENKKLSFHDKKIENSNISWSQLQYLTALNLDKGSIVYGQHNSVIEVEDYLKKNGDDSLPNSVIEGIVFDINLTIKVFLREFVYLIKPLTRYIGVLFLFSMFLYLRLILIEKNIMKILKNNVIILFSLIYICLICLVITTYLEPRWLINAFVLLPIVFMNRVYLFRSENKLGNRFDFAIVNIQIGFMLFMNLPYIYKNITLITELF